jgi:paraquat-inducible protein B
MPHSESNTPLDKNHVKEAVYTRKRRRFSSVWIVPIVALLIGIVLVVKSLSQKGPEITILFKSAEGITAEKSVIKYRDIVVGKVTDVSFTPDLKSVVVKAELKKTMAPYLHNKTKFWVVYARLTTNAVEGLDTLLSGAYIGMEPSKEGQETRVFKGLEEPPVIKDPTRGKRFILEANDRGSFQVGSPIYYKKIQAGSVVDYKLSPDGRRVFIDIFIFKPYTNFVTDTTRFWNASGIDATIGTNGVEIRTESLTAIISGGIAFDNFEVFGEGKPVREKHHFVLFRNVKEAKKITYKRELYFWVYFKESIRGLKVGAPVEFRGVKIGEVVDFYLTGDANTAEFRIPILFKIEPARFTITGSDHNASSSVDEKIFRKLVEKGFRAQLQSGNLLTGDLLINLDFYPDAKKVELKKESGLLVFPSVPATIESLKNNVQAILENLAAVPFKEIGEETQKILQQVNQDTIPGINLSINDVNKELLPSFKRLIDNSDKTMQEIRRNYIDTNAEIHRKMLKLLDEITRTSRSVRNLTDYLERHPESIIRGK